MLYMCVFVSRDVFLFETFDPPEARYPSGGQRTCFCSRSLTRRRQDSKAEHKASIRKYIRK